MKYVGVFAFCVSVLFPLYSHAQIEHPVEGGWEWVRTEYSDGTVVTPESAGYSVQLYFGSDQEFIRYHNETELQVSTWSIGCAYIPPYLVEFLSTGVGDDWNFGIDGYEEESSLYLFDHIQLPNGSGSPPDVTEIYSYRGTVSVEGQSWGSLKAAFR